MTRYQNKDKSQSVVAPGSPGSSRKIAVFERARVKGKRYTVVRCYVLMEPTGNVAFIVVVYRFFFFSVVLWRYPWVLSIPRNNGT